ncbi:ankyrin repeat protein [Oesophagostomum dentatum]|uniref:Ankyrin repeat protein n=1 Tax=Oesophagostomum dentatum TaxID=61180 RepID=A0A0B1TV26_OESDE|nr:ankyrin repeat protein [Oesophagostomum dentatum]
MVAFLVTNGAQVEKRDVEGFTPLHVAAQFGATPVVGYLVARGQSVDAPDESRITPAMWAAAKVRAPANYYVLRVGKIGLVPVSARRSASTVDYSWC